MRFLCIKMTTRNIASKRQDKEGRYSSEPEKVHATCEFVTMTYNGEGSTIGSPG